MERVLSLLLLLIVAATAVPLTNEEFPDVGMEPGKFPKGPLREGTGYPDVSVPPKEQVDTKSKDGSQYIDLLPPKWHPGDVMKASDGQEFSDISKALEDVLRSGDVMEDRLCAIGVANSGGGRTLSNPQYWFYSGMASSSPPFSMDNSETGLSLFSKTPWALRGSVGVLTYDIDGTDYKVAVMWSVPYDFNLYDVFYNTKIFPKSSAVDSQMWDTMYYHAGAWKAVGYHERTEYGIHLYSTMTDNIKSKLIVWVDTTNFDPSGSPELHADCSYHAGWVAKYCWQECTRGFCWVDRRCSSKSDCGGGPLTCYTDCKK